VKEAEQKEGREGGREGGRERGKEDFYLFIGDPARDLKKVEIEGGREEGQGGRIGAGRKRKSVCERERREGGREGGRESAKVFF